MLEQVKIFDFRSSPVLAEARGAKQGFSYSVHILLFFVVFMLGTSIAQLPATFYQVMRVLPTALEMGENLDTDVLLTFLMDVMQERGYLLCTLFGTGFCMLIVLGYIRLIEKRNLRSLGFFRAGAIRQYLFGLALGAGIFSAAIGLAVASGAASLSPVAYDPWYVFLFLSYHLLHLFEAQSFYLFHLINSIYQHLMDLQIQLHYLLVPL